MATDIWGGEARSLPGTIHRLYRNEFKKRFRETSLLPLITNSSMKGVFAHKGDVIEIPIKPIIKTHKTAPGEKVIYQKAKGTSEKFFIGRERYWALSFEQEQQLFEAFNTKSPILEEANIQMTEDVELEALTDFPGKVSAQNTGNTAGHKSGAFDLGAVGGTNNKFNSVKLFKLQSQCDADSTEDHKEVAADYVVNCIDCLREQPGTKGRKLWVVVPTIVGNKIHTGEVKMANWMGDDKSRLREDIEVMGSLGGADVLISDKVPFSTETVNGVTSKVYPILFGSTEAVSFANEAVFRDGAMKDIGDWDEYHRAKFVYDWHFLYPEFIGCGYVRV